MPIPSKYVRLCSEFYYGQDSMFYAVASTGDLSLGTIRPWNDDENRPMNDTEWKGYLWDCLSVEINFAIRDLKKCPSKQNDRYVKKFESFQAGVDRMIRKYEFLLTMGAE